MATLIIKTPGSSEYLERVMAAMPVEHSAAKAVVKHLVASWRH